MQIRLIGLGRMGANMATGGIVNAIHPEIFRAAILAMIRPHLVG